MSETYLVSKEQCPRCKTLGKDRSHDNLAVYSDGHRWCFSCGYYVPSDGISKAQNVLRTADSVSAKRIGLPEDVEFQLPEVAWRWLQQYSLSKEDILHNKLMWSESWQRLIFPYFEETELLAWQGRYFGTDPKKGKWFSQGDLKDILHICGPTKGNKLILVEDIVSAIRVGHQLPCMPIFGSHISSLLLLRLRRFYREVVIWLDKDKQCDSVKFSNTARLFGMSSGSIITEKDPKEYTDDEIQAILAGAD